jgi:hypothetical protein
MDDGGGKEGMTAAIGNEGRWQRKEKAVAKG